MRKKWWIILIIVILAAAAVLGILLGLKLSEQRIAEAEAASVSVSDVPGISLYQTPEEHIVIDDREGHAYVDNELLVTAAKGVSESEIIQIIRDIGAAVAGKNEYLNQYQIVLDRACSFDELERLRDELSDFEEIAAADMNYYLILDQNYYPGDDKWKNEWSSTPGGRNWGMEAIHAPELWDVLRAESTWPIKVGVLDNQFYTEHEDLKQNFKEVFLNNFHNPNDSDTEYRHGTHTSGTIAAVYDNGKGVTGVLPKAALYGASMEGLTGRDMKENIFGITIAEYTAGMSYLIAVKECRVVNLSYGGGYGAEDAKEEGRQLSDTLRAFLQLGQEFVISKSSGNSRCDYETYDIFSYITDQDVLDRIITVGAAKLGSDGNIYIAEYSNYGEAVDLIAPGSDIYSTVSWDSSPFSAFSWSWDWFSSSYTNMSGTSMAAPHVAGTAAAIWTLNPDLTGAQIKKIVCETAHGKYEYESLDRQPTVTINKTTYQIRNSDVYMAAFGYTYKMLDAQRAANWALTFTEEPEPTVTPAPEESQPRENAPIRTQVPQINAELMPLFSMKYGEVKNLYGGEFEHVRGPLYKCLYNTSLDLDFSFYFSPELHSMSTEDPNWNTAYFDEWDTDPVRSISGRADLILPGLEGEWNYERLAESLLAPAGYTFTAYPVTEVNEIRSNADPEPIGFQYGMRFSLNDGNTYMISCTDTEIIKPDTVIMMVIEEETDSSQADNAANDDSSGDSGGSNKDVSMYGIPNGTYRSNDAINQTFTFYGQNGIKMSAFGISADGTYEIKNGQIIVTYEFLGHQVWNPSFSMSGNSLFIAGTEFIRESGG